MALDFQTFQQQARFPGLDGIRCLAILAVIWHHTAASGPLPGLSRGFLGVDLFFVLSGFLITTLLLRERQRTGKISLKQFWIRRFLRLMPAYYGSLVLLALAYTLFKPGDPETQTFLSGLPIYLLYLSNWFDPGASNLGPLWSLATEEQFYLIWPIIEAFLVPLMAGIVWIAFLIINQLINFGLLDPAITALFGVEPGQHPDILQTTFTPILLGVALAHILFRKALFQRIAPYLSLPASPVIYGIVLLVLINIPSADISGILRLAIHVAMTAWIGAILLHPASPITSALSWKPVILIGMISYGMYLYHMWCVHVVRIILDKLGLHTPFVLFFGASIATVIVAAASYFLYERWFLTMRHRFRPTPSAN